MSVPRTCELCGRDFDFKPAAPLKTEDPVLARFVRECRESVCGECTPRMEAWLKGQTGVTL